MICDDVDWDHVLPSLLAAFLLHIVFLILLVILGMERNRPYQEVRLQSAVRVEVLALPKLTLRELSELDRRSKLDIKREKAAEALKLDEVLKDLSKSDIFSASSANPSAAQEGRKEEKREEKNAGTVDREKLEKLMGMGNKIATGQIDALKTMDGISVPAVSAYLQLLKESIRPHWVLPSYLINENNNYQCAYRVKISKYGQILELSIIQASNSIDYDQRAKAAILAPDRLPSPPEDLLKVFARDGVVLGFPL